MAKLACQTCGYVYDSTDTTHAAEFSSTTTYSKNDYCSPAQIATAGEDIETCPRDPVPARDADGDIVQRGGATPKGGSMVREGSDNRYTAGDETHPSKDDMPPLRSKDNTLEGS